MTFFVIFIWKCYYALLLFRLTDWIVNKVILLFRFTWLQLLSVNEVLLLFRFPWLELLPVSAVLSCFRLTWLELLPFNEVLLLYRLTWLELLPVNELLLLFRFTWLELMCSLARSMKIFARPLITWMCLWSLVLNIQ